MIICVTSPLRHSHKRSLCIVDGIAKSAVLDFSHVTDVDSSALQVCRSRSFQLMTFSNGPHTTVTLVT